jgi:tRNA threonylcarbamoyl adenosine modification protein YeaZ
LKLLLAIDSSAATSAAVLSDRLLSLVKYEDPFGHAEGIGNVIAQALAEAGVKASDITAVAIGRGPAPYTGLRVGMAAGLAFAQARNIPVYGVMVLDAVAHSLSAPKLVLYSDAKRKEVFVAEYVDGVRTLGPQVRQPSELEGLSDYEQVAAVCDAGQIGLFTLDQLSKGLDLSDVSALYLRSPDVRPSPPKKVSG